MLTIALTGNAAAGKSTVAELWRAAGVPLVSADDLARAAVEPGSEGLALVVAEFGEGVRAPGGELDRGAVRQIVFRDPEARERLEAILHPRIEAARLRWLSEREEEGARLAVAEVPLLFEAGLQDRFDVTILVDAPESVRLERLIHDRGLSREIARGILDAQMDPATKREKADFVLDNAGTKSELCTQALSLLERLRARAGGES